MLHFEATNVCVKGEIQKWFPLHFLPTSTSRRIRRWIWVLKANYWRLVRNPHVIRWRLHPRNLSKTRITSCQYNALKSYNKKINHTKSKTGNKILSFFKENCNTWRSSYFMFNQFWEILSWLLKSKHLKLQRKCRIHTFRGGFKISRRLT